jgi:hypothetical protein
MSVFRDPYGIPHLRADSVDELAALQGSNAAWDRAWQIELARLRAVGEVSGALGRTGSTGTCSRRARLADTPAAARPARRAHQTLARGVCGGVNGDPLAGAEHAPEFAAIGIRPGQWAPWVPIAVFWPSTSCSRTFPTSSTGARTGNARPRGDGMVPDRQSTRSRQQRVRAGGAADHDRLAVDRRRPASIPGPAGRLPRFASRVRTSTSSVWRSPAFRECRISGTPGPSPGRSRTRWPTTRDLFRETARDQDGVWARRPTAGHAARCASSGSRSATTPFEVEAIETSADR